jgi:hypothetical protein
MAKPSSPKHLGAAATSSALVRLRELASAAKQPTRRPSAKSAAKKATPKAEKATAKAEKATAKAEKATAKAEKATAKPVVATATAVTPVGEEHTPTAAPELSTGAGVLSRVAAMLARVPKEHVAAPEQPVPHLISESLALLAVARRYADKLGKIGFSDAMLGGLQLYAQALHEAQAQLDSLRGKHVTQAEQRTFLQASELRTQLLLAGRLVLRKDRKALEALDAIAEGEGLADLARDLLDLALVVETYPTDLERLGLGVEAAVKARELAKKLTAKLDAQKPKTDAERAAEDLRNRAATVLQELIAEARLGGAYLFRKEPRVALLFTATHLPRRRGSR